MNISTVKENAKMLRILLKRHYVLEIKILSIREKLLIDHLRKVGKV